MLLGVMNESESAVFRLLSLDGGGIKALYSARVLSELESVLGRPWPAHVGWISGTSSGGILALGLAAGHTAKGLGDFLEREGPHIFPNHPDGWRAQVQRTSQLFRQLRLKGKYSPRRLERGLQQLFGDMTLADLKTDVSVASVNLTTGARCVFTRASHPRVRAVDVALATSATPGYFNPHAIEGELYADGGLWVNSPALSGLVEAQPKYRGVGRLEVLSIGTVEQPEGYRSAGPPTSLPQWIQRMLHASTYGQAALTHDAVSAFLPQLAPETSYLRIPPPVIPWEATGPVRMDTTHPAALELLSRCGREEGQRQLRDSAVQRFMWNGTHV